MIRLFIYQEDVHMFKKFLQFLGALDLITLAVLLGIVVIGGLVGDPEDGDCDFDAHM